MTRIKLMGGMLAVILVAAPTFAKQSMYGLPALSRADFNRLAAAAGVPVLWALDEGQIGIPEPAELVGLGVLEGSTPFVADGKLTPAFEKLYRRLVEAKRLEVVRKELDQGIPTLVRTDLSRLRPAEKLMVGHILKAADKIEALFQKQMATDELGKDGTLADAESAALFARNQGPWCMAPQTERDPFCNALSDFPQRKWGPYPMDMEHNLELCDLLASQANSDKLLDPFTVVRKTDEGLVAVPLIEEYQAEMTAIAADLDLAAKAATAAGEKAFARYLTAAAKSFRTGDWLGADEAWSVMNSRNSRWYLRIAPDETYWDLCQAKAGFHVSFALIDRSALALQDQLTKLRSQMEKSLGEIAPAYKPRSVKFSMPDFIEIIVNSGNSRSPLGATIGQSLPNWGKVANEGRGRTVVMSNLYTDPDSQALAKTRAALMLEDETLALYSTDKRVALIDIILHEATHNLGPHSDSKIDGKDPRQIFGGPVATVLEELKAQTGAWFYTELLRKAGVISDLEAKQIYTHALAWSFGHLSQGLFAPNGNPKPYSQLSAIQVGFLVDAGALAWVDTVDSATGQTVGKFKLDYEKVPAAVSDLMAKVVTIKATGDTAAAKELIDRYVVGDGAKNVHQQEIAQRYLEFSKGTLVYSIDFGK
ncbi:MAG TPA: hypothetical protein GX737_09160 [Oligoflexales bacterium]|jgi:hypothetical protein|nr:hypothetical protein [Oligoflexales bacterium]